jgi:hypothetical protein
MFLSRTCVDLCGCRAIGGVVVQERANGTALVGVAVELTVRSPRSETTAKLRLEAH